MKNRRAQFESVVEYGSLPQLVEGAGLDPVQLEFESLVGYRLTHGSNL